MCCSDELSCSCPFFLRKHQTANFPPGILWTGDPENVFFTFNDLIYSFSYFVITCCIWLTALLLPASYYLLMSSTYRIHNIGLRLLLWALHHEANRRVEAKKKVHLFHSERGELPLTENLTWHVAALHSGWQCFLPPLWFFFFNLLNTRGKWQL